MNHKIEYRIVIGGHAEDPGGVQGTCKCANPFTQNFDNYDPSKFEFINMLTPAGQEATTKMPRPPEPGTIVACLVNDDPSNPSTPLVIGTFSTAVNNAQTAEPGNNILTKWLNWASKLGLDMNIPGSAKTKMERGAEVRDIDSGEKGEWKHELTKGLPVHLALSSLMGQIIPQNKQIPTAKKESMGIPSASMLSQLPGSAMSLSSLLSGLTKKQMKQATQNMPQEVLDAFTSLSYLATDIEVNSASLMGNRVHPETFIANAIELLSQAKSIEDLLSIFDRLRYDTTLFGLDKLEATEFKANTAYGQITMTLDALGNLLFDSNSQNLLAAAASTLTSSMQSSQSGDPTKNLFGDGTKQMQEAFTRLAGSGEEFRNKLVRDAVEKTKNAKHDTVHKYTSGEGRPLAAIFNINLGA
jgi:hypothetical protein